MRTLYIDVYFLINFTVDYFSAYFGVKFAHLVISARRLIMTALIGAAFAVLDLFIPDFFALHIVVGVLTLASMCAVVSGCASLKSRIRFCFLFFLSEILIGGLVQVLYGFLDRFLLKYLTEEQGVSNKSALVFSVVILFVIGVIKLFITVLSNSGTEKSVVLNICLGDKSCEVEALVDSGNLVKDPLSMIPVMFVKKTIAQRIFPRNVIELEKIDMLDKGYRKRIRLIPITRNGQTHVLTGVKVDSITVSDGANKLGFEFIVAIDKEEGSFGGYEALVPSLPY